MDQPETQIAHVGHVDSGLWWNGQSL